MLILKILTVKWFLSKFTVINSNHNNSFILSSHIGQFRMLECVTISINGWNQSLYL